jgi:ABC-type Fe3+-hydroxamate transport system substrate-binding protein
MQAQLFDAYGNCHTPISYNQTVRIVCLVPSITELLCDLGLQEYIVGRTGFCIHPETLKSIPKIGGTKDVNIEKIRQLQATHLIVNIDENEKPTVDLLAQFIPHVIVTHPISPKDNVDLYHLLGRIFNVETESNHLCIKFEEIINQIEPERNEKKVLYCIWKDPWMCVSKDTYIAQMLALKNWKTVKLDSDQRYPKFELNDPTLKTLDAILLSSEPYRFTEQHVFELKQKLNIPVFLIDGEMLSWYGSRAIQGLHYLNKLNFFK